MMTEGNINLPSTSIAVARSAITASGTAVVMPDDPAMKNVSLITKLRKRISLPVTTFTTSEDAVSDMVLIIRDVLILELLLYLSAIVA